jgi:hypothetical protein
MYSTSNTVKKIPPRRGGEGLEENGTCCYISIGWEIPLEDSQHIDHTLTPTHPPLNYRPLKYKILISLYRMDRVN